MATKSTERNYIVCSGAIMITSPYDYTENKKLQQILLKFMKALLNSNQVMELLNIKSPTTLIKYERLGIIKVTRRLGNRKRYSMSEIKKFLGN